MIKLNLQSKILYLKGILVQNKYTSFSIRFVQRKCVEACAMGCWSAGIRKPSNNDLVILVQACCGGSICAGAPVTFDTQLGGKVNFGRVVGRDTRVQTAVPS